jgi:spectinomycin phosphotransferase
VLGKPRIADASIIVAGRDGYGLAIRSLDFLPMGRDSRAWVYRAEVAAGQRYFLKVRQLPVQEAGMAVPAYLHEHGIDQAVAAIPTATGRFWHRLGRYALVIYPFVEGASVTKRRLSDSQWVAYGAFLRALHDTRLPAELERQVPRESYRPDATDVIRRFLVRRPAVRSASAARVGLAAFWWARRHEIAQLLERAETLGAGLAKQAPGFVLCHADIHKGNLLIDEHDDLRVVDWDGLVLAPRERDLMFIVGGVVVPPRVEPREEGLFFRGYGPVDLDELALAYYRCAWAVQDIDAFAEEVFLRAGTDEATRSRSATAFRALFARGGEVDSARGS